MNPNGYYEFQRHIMDAIAERENSGERYVIMSGRRSGKSYIHEMYQMWFKVLDETQIEPEDYFKDNEDLFNL